MSGYSFMWSNFPRMHSWHMGFLQLHILFPCITFRSWWDIFTSRTAVSQGCIHKLFSQRWEINEPLQRLHLWQLEICSLRQFNVLSDCHNYCFNLSTFQPFLSCAVSVCSRLTLRSVRDGSGAGRLPGRYVSLLAVLNSVHGRCRGGLLQRSGGCCFPRWAAHGSLVEG